MHGALIVSATLWLPNELFTSAWQSGYLEIILM